jgi:hypothetical protein
MKEFDLEGITVIIGQMCTKEKKDGTAIVFEI